MIRGRRFFFLASHNLYSRVVCFHAAVKKKRLNAAIVYNHRQPRQNLCHTITRLQTCEGETSYYLKLYVAVSVRLHSSSKQLHCCHRSAQQTIISPVDLFFHFILTGSHNLSYIRNEMFTPVSDTLTLV